MPGNMTEPSRKEEEMDALLSQDENKDEEKGESMDGKGIKKEHHVESPQANVIQAISACALYVFCSVSMVLCNKSLASSYNKFLDEGRNLNFFLVVFQAVVAVICVQFSKSVGWVDYPAFNFKTAIQWAPVNIFFCGMLFTGMASLEHNSVPMVTVFKNITNIIVTFGDYYFFSTKVTTFIILAFGVMLGGALLAAENDTSVTFAGLFWMALNCLSTSGYVLYMKYATKNVKLSKFGMVFYNNVLCTAFLLPVTLLNGEMRTFFQTTSLHTFDYIMKNSFAGVVGFFLNFASLTCVSITGPTTYAIVGSMNKIPIVIIGWFMFNEEISGQTWTFIGISLLGGFLYSFAKLIEGKKEEGSKKKDQDEGEKLNKK